MLKIFFIALIAGFVGFGGYWFLSQPKTPSANVSAPPFPPDTAKTPAPLPNSITEKIKVVPINADKFQKTIVDIDNCNNPVGLVAYHDKNTNSSMKINSTSLKHNPDITQGVDDLIKFLDLGKQSNFQDIGSLEFVFRDYCGGSAHYLVKELPSIKYHSTDRVRALMDFSAQAPVSGEIFVVIYAQKGDNLIKLSKHLGDQILYKDHKEKCDINKYNGDGKVADECYKKEILLDANLEQLSTQTANNLVTLFSIK